MYPEPLFEIFGRPVVLYGVLIAVGILACLAVLYIYTGKKGMPSKLQDFIFFIAILAIALGFLAAALVQAFFNYLESGTFDLFSGITVMGGLIGGAAAFLAAYFGIGHFIFKGKEKDLHVKYFGMLFNVAPLCILIAHAFGRLGCLMAGCCHGAYLGQEYVVGGIWMNGGYYVPSQLYEALFLFVAFAVLSVLYFKRCNIIMPIYLISYGVWRFIIEFARADHRGSFIPGLSPSQWQSFIFIGLGIAILIYYIVKKIPLWLPKPVVQDAPSEETAPPENNSNN